MTAGPLTALLAGATGLVGGECLRRLLASPVYETVAVVTRRAVGSDPPPPKLRQYIVDFAQLESVRA